MDIEIRLANIEEQEEILQLQSNSLRVLASENYNSEQIESLIRSQAVLRFQSELIFVAVYQNKIVGFAALLLDRLEIGGVYVDPNFARRKIGSRLLEEVEKTAIKKEYKFLYVLSSLTGFKFYEKQGYKWDYDTQFWSEETVGVPCKVLKKRLIPLTASEKRERLMWLLILVLIVVISLAIALIN